MREKLVRYLINWKRPCRLLPPPWTEVLVRFRPPNDGYAVLLYDPKEDLWHVAPHQGSDESLCYSTHEIFAWTRLPKAILNALYEVATPNEERS